MYLYTLNILLGYIPKAQHYFGDRHALVSSIAHMEEDQQKYNEHQRRLRKETQCQGQHDGLMRLNPISEKTKMYFPKGIQHSLSPFTLTNDDPRKYMMSGYTGFVPRLRGIIGKL